jgi:hypothetical protein
MNANAITQLWLNFSITLTHLLYLKKKREIYKLPVPKQNVLAGTFIREVSVHRWASCVTLRQVTVARGGDEPGRAERRTIRIPTEGK